ncbi:hypothetical protein SAMN05216203_1533 [Marinobacter daqiaonensis]|uniref:Holin-X, holin superfamily III n=1 Tax=Marinobacter daqiaonensis TaxID=650891 RepID=A0A1I6HTN1_9GAMM|nr:hypothetical protein [Marinobacter daqiaonensis]SFR57758.1 hypothetical protein SAMN05216203_1533 [Marinobacter daqiaonensis]
MVSKQELEGLARKAVAAVIGFMLTMALLTALLLGGIVLLLWALTEGLTPHVGQAGALGISGGLCFLLLGLFFWRLLKTSSSHSDEGGAEPRSMQDRLADMIRQNPLEAALGAFALGLFGQTDPKVRAMILQSGAAFMQQAQNDGGSSGADGEGGPETPEPPAPGAP